MTDGPRPNPRPSGAGGAAEPAAQQVVLGDINLIERAGRILHPPGEPMRPTGAARGRRPGYGRDVKQTVEHALCLNQPLARRRCKSPKSSISS